MNEQFDFEQYKKQAVEGLLSCRKEIGGPDSVLGLGGLVGLIWV